LLWKGRAWTHSRQGHTSRALSECRELGRFLPLQNNKSPWAAVGSRSGWKGCFEKPSSARRSLLPRRCRRPASWADGAPQVAYVSFDFKCNGHFIRCGPHHQRAAIAAAQSTAADGGGEGRNSWAQG